MRTPHDKPPSGGHDKPRAGGADVTDRRRAEEELRRSEERFRSVFDHAPIGILLLDPDVRIIRANRAICDMLGYSEAELVGRVVTELVHPADRAESERMRGRVAAGEVDHLAVERRALCKDGRVVCLEVRSSAQRDADGRLELVITQLVDVTEQRAHEAKLRESEQHWRTIFATAPIGMALIAPLGGLLEVNRALAAMLGRSPSELQGMSVTDIIHPDDLEATRGQVEEALLGRRDTIAGESRYRRGDGGLVWGAYLSTLIRDAEGSPRYFISQVIDTTDRRLAEEALRDSEARYRGLVEQSQDLIVRMDLADNLTFVNDAWCAKFGLRREDVIGRSVMPRIFSDDHGAAKGAMRALATPPYRTRIEVRQPTVEGLRWIEWEGSGILDEHGRVNETQAIGRDITHAHKVAEALRASEARYRGLVESQQAVVLRMDLEGGITFVNDYGSRVLGVSREAMLGTSVYQWIHPEDRDAARSTIESELGPPYHASVESRVEAEGQVRWFVWEGTAILDEHGEPIEFQSVGFDVTERRAAADALRASLEDLRQSEEKLRLLAQRQVAVREAERKRLGFDLHDGVCQELIGIGILVESVRQRIGAASAPAGDLVRVGNYLAEVVEHLRLLAGELRPMLLHDLGLEDSLRSLALGLSSETTTISAVFPSRVPRLEEAAEVAIYRIAQEALANAIRHARARSVRLELATLGGRLRLEVRDDGCGFDPGSRRRTSALGLLSMEERALAIGGRLDVRSLPGKGTTVVLECPVVARASAA